MKKTLILILVIILIFIISINPKEKINNKEEIRGVFISYIELSEYVKEEESTSKKNIDKMISNIKKLKLNTVILQVRSNTDAIYKSKIFPTSLYISNEEGKYTYDVLEYFINKCHENNIKLYAWINPYRIRTTEDTTTITKSNPAYKYLNTDTIYINNGIYFNPAKKEVTKLVVDGVVEIVKYNIDGVLFDDYFYPSSDIDINDYNEYIKNNNYIDIDEYHLNIINDMVKRVHEVCKNNNVVFGISPDGNIENNYTKNYADVKRWLSSSEYVDFIMPQIYYGFYNSSKDYINTTKEWESILKNKNIDLIIALAFYKVGKEDMYAKEGLYEWIQNDNIIMKEVLLSRNLNNYKGFSLFRYDNLFNTEIYTSTSINEIENMKKIIK